jgi:hypothetical protein
LPKGLYGCRKRQFRIVVTKGRGAIAGFAFTTR